MNIRYLLDENLPPHWRKHLMNHEPTLVVCRVGDPGAPALGTADPAILEWCEANGFVLVTNNRKSLPGHLLDHLANGKHVPGILVLSATINTRRLVEDLILIAGASFEGE